MSSAFPDNDPHRLPDPESSRASTAPGGGAKILVYLLFLLAVVATIIMFFVDNDAWQKIAVVAALWAAFIGAVLVSRYSGQLSEEKARTRELEARSAAAIDNERARSKARELELERNYNDRVQEGRDETIASIREELAALRLQLSELSGLDLSEEQVSVRARAERIIELERTVQRAEETAATPSEQPEQPATRHRSPSPQQPQTPSDPSDGHRGGRRGAFATGSFTAVNWSGVDAEATTQLPLVVDNNPLNGADNGEVTPAQPQQDGDTGYAGVHERGGYGRQPAPSTEDWTPRAPQDADQDADQAPQGRGHAAPAEESGHHRRAAAQEEEPKGRRRADDGTSGVTVAELMAQLKKNSR
jgi:hypothetical protein